MGVASMFHSEFLVTGGLALGLDLFFALGVVMLINYRKQLTKSALKNLPIKHIGKNKLHFGR